MLKCALLNVCGLRKKLIGIEFEIFVNSYDIVFLTETKLPEQMSSNDLNIPGYTMMCKNRKNAKHASGGVAILIKNEYINKCEIVEGK